MLKYLSVQNLGIIQDLEINFEAGFNVLTGETGAGKTLVVEALSILSGQKSSNSLVGPYGNNCLLEAVFEDAINGNRQLVRSVNKSGKSKAWIDSELVPISEINSLGSALIEIFSQHSQLKLLKPTYVSKVLDNFAGIDSSDLDNLKQKLQKVNRQLAEFETGKLSINEVEFYESQLEEIRSCKISSENELDELIKEQELLSESQKIISAAVEARTHLVSLDESGFSDAITEVSRAIGSIETLPKELAEGILQRLLSVRTEISDLAYDLNNIADKITLDSTYLDQISERIQMLKKLERKYGGTISQVLDTEKKLTATIDLAKNSTDSKQMLYREKELLEIQVTDLKTEITEQRRSAVKELQDTVLNYLKELALTEAQFEIRVEGAGSTDVEFLISTNISQGLHPISQVASGGELSRIMLALNLALKNGAKYVTDGAALIFDEVDTGIGGQTALNIGQSLAKLATKEQILVVTHLPQVAAFADSHFKISKTNSDTTEVIIEKLSDNLRAEEINRMLSGITGTESGLAHAKELLEAADMQKSNR